MGVGSAGCGAPDEYDPAGSEEEDEEDADDGPSVFDLFSGKPRPSAGGSMSEPEHRCGWATRPRVRRGVATNRNRASHDRSRPDVEVPARILSRYRTADRI